MSVKMLELQNVDGKLVQVGDVIDSDATTEAALVAHGKAEKMPDPQLDLDISNKGKGGKN